MNKLKGFTMALLMAMAMPTLAVDVADPPIEEAEGVWQGRVDGLNIQQGWILVDDRTFYFTTGTAITRGNKPAAMKDVQIGGAVRVIPQLPLPFNKPPHLTQIQILK